MTPERKLLIQYDRQLAPGDYAVLTPLIRDLKAVYGDRYQIDVKCSTRALFLGNPNLNNLNPDDPSVEHIVLGYKQGMDAAGRGEKIHFTNWLYRDFFAKTRIHVPQLKPKCDFYLSQKEKNFAPVSGRYWLVFGGGKTDFTVKHWDFQWYQQVVDRLRPLGLRFVQTGSTAEGHVHPRMTNVLNLVGWGYLRELVWQIAHAEGIICPITCGMHIASAFNKPCVVIAGGREEPWWEAYDNSYGQFGPDCEKVSVEHRFLHTIGDLFCCRNKGCWANKLKLTSTDNKVCSQLAHRPPGQQVLPECMDMIKPENVFRAVLSYYQDGTLPPPPTGDIPEPQILDENVPWQPVANQSAEKPYEFAPRRRGVKWSHPKLAGKLTVCVLLGSRDTRAVLRSILDTVPRLRLNLRVGYVVRRERIGKQTVPVAEASLDALNFLQYIAPFAQTFTGSDLGSLRAQMLSNIDTRFVAWFDGNTSVVHDDWLNKLGDVILKQVTGTDFFGLKRQLEDGTPCFDTQFFAARSSAVASLLEADGSFNFRKYRHSGGRICPFNAGKSLVFYPNARDNPEVMTLKYEPVDRPFFTYDSGEAKDGKISHQADD